MFYLHPLRMILISYRAVIFKCCAVVTCEIKLFQNISAFVDVLLK